MISESNLANHLETAFGVTPVNYSYWKLGNGVIHQSIDLSLQNILQEC